MDEERRARNVALIKAAASDAVQCQMRRDLAAYSAGVFADSGRHLHVAGHILGNDRMDGRSPFKNGNDEAVAIALILLMASQLVSSSSELLIGGRAYAGAALLRQLVEIEYLAWAFENRDEDAAIWLRSDKKIRENFFRPAKLRDAAGGKFRGSDYGFHCELGGHPVPQATLLLQDDDGITQLLLSDLLGHTGRIWDHLAGR